MSTDACTRTVPGRWCGGAALQPQVFGQQSQLIMAALWTHYPGRDGLTQAFQFGIWSGTP